MSSLITNPRGERILKNHAFRFHVTFERGGKTDTSHHDNFAEVIGEALYAAHGWIQHEWNLPTDKYTITRAERLLRSYDRQLDCFSVVGQVELELDPTVRGNPVVPRPEKKAKKKDDYADGALPFMDEVPSMTRYDVERQREKEALVWPKGSQS